MLYSINWKDSIAWLPLLLEILGNMCIAIVFFSGCDLKNFEINHFFLVKLYSHMTETSREKCKYLDNKKSS